jgi:hypothetical protein
MLRGQQNPLKRRRKKKKQMKHRINLDPRVVNSLCRKCLLKCPVKNKSVHAYNGWVSICAPYEQERQKRLKMVNW